MEIWPSNGRNEMSEGLEEGSQKEAREWEEQILQARKEAHEGRLYSFEEAFREIGV